MAADIVVGKHLAEEIDPNVLNLKKPRILFKSETHSYYVQNGRVFTLNGAMVAGPETSKQDLWKIQSENVGKEAMDAAGLDVTLAESESERVDQKVFACTTCGQSFLSVRSLSAHSSLHSAPKNSVRGSAPVEKNAE